MMTYKNVKTMSNNVPFSWSLYPEIFSHFQYTLSHVFDILLRGGGLCIKENVYIVENLYIAFDQ